jgi:hypothetical protein
VKYVVIDITPYISTKNDLLNDRQVKLSLLLDRISFMLGTKHHLAYCFTPEGVRLNDSSEIPEDSKVLLFGYRSRF